MYVTLYGMHPYIAALWILMYAGSIKLRSTLESMVVIGINQEYPGIEKW